MRSEFRLVGFENSQTTSTSKVWTSDHREDYMSSAWPFYSFVQIFPVALHSDKQGVVDYMTELVKTTSEETRP